MKIETITNGGHSSFTTNSSVYIDISIGQSKRSLVVEADDRVFDESNPEDTKEI